MPVGACLVVALTRLSGNGCGEPRRLLLCTVVMDIVPDTDTPDPADRTLQRLELTVALDDVFPQWRSMVGEPQRDGAPLGWMAIDTVPAVVVLVEDEQNPVRCR